MQILSTETLRFGLKKILFTYLNGNNDLYLLNNAVLFASNVKCHKILSICSTKCLENLHKYGRANISSAKTNKDIKDTVFKCEIFAMVNLLCYEDSVCRCWMSSPIGSAGIPWACRRRSPVVYYPQINLFSLTDLTGNMFNKEINMSLLSPANTIVSSWAFQLRFQRAADRLSCQLPNNLGQISANIILAFIYSVHEIFSIRILEWFVFKSWPGLPLCKIQPFQQDTLLFTKKLSLLW